MIFCNLLGLVSIVNLDYNIFRVRGYGICSLVIFIPFFCLLKSCIWRYMHKNDQNLNSNLESKNKNNFNLNKKIRFKLIIMVIIMFAFGFALIPFYKTICEITGINILSITEQNNKKLQNTQIDNSRKVSIELDANVHGGFKFEPQVKHVEVYPGEIKQVIYKVTNISDKNI